MFAHSEQHLQPSPSFYKTRLCFQFLRAGVCSLGEDCRFAHGSGELRSATAEEEDRETGAEARSKNSAAGSARPGQPLRPARGPTAGQQPRAAAAPAAAAGRQPHQALSSQLLAVQQQVQQMQAQLAALEALARAGGAAPAPRAPEPTKDCAGAGPGAGFSRQTTQTTAEPDPADREEAALLDFDGEDLDFDFREEAAAALLDSGGEDLEAEGPREEAAFLDFEGGDLEAEGPAAKAAAAARAAPPAAAAVAARPHTSFTLCVKNTFLDVAEEPPAGGLLPRRARSGSPARLSPAAPRGA